MNAMTILVVDDEKDLADLIRFNLARNHYRVLVAHDGETAVELARREHPDLVILDLMLPRLSGQEVLVRLRGDADTRGIPVIVLTAKSEESDVVVGLELGADDYVTKPFSVKVLLARVAAVLRRGTAPEEEGSILRAGPLAIDRGRHLVELDGEPVPLTLTEFRLLEALVSAKSRVLARDQLMARAIGEDVMVTDRTIDVHVTSLRRKLGNHRDLVETVRGVGYRFANVWDATQVEC